MLFDIHTAMQDADNFDLAFCMAVKNHMLANAIFEIALPDVVACAAQIGFIHQIVKRSIKLRQIMYLLYFSPLPARVATNGK